MDMTSLATSSRHFSKFEKMVENAAADAALILMQRQRRLQISRAKNIGNVCELRGVAFRLAHPMVGVLLI